MKTIRYHVRDGVHRDAMLPVVLDPRTLRGQPPAKTCALGTVWRGEAKPAIDAQLDTLEDLVTTVGPTEKVLDLGTIWTGGMLSRLDSQPPPNAQGNTVDTSEVLKEVAGLHAAMIANTPTSVRIFDAIRRVRDAASRVGRGTRDAVNPLTKLVRITDEQRRFGIEANARAAEFWSRPAPVSRPTGDSSGTASTAFRDAHDAVQRATSAYALNEALNAQARAFWQRT
jgi:hypothetical protein